jgi:hypothetical protein
LPSEIELRPVTHRVQFSTLLGRPLGPFASWQGQSPAPVLISCLYDMHWVDKCFTTANKVLEPVANLVICSSRRHSHVTLLSAVSQFHVGNNPRITLQKPASIARIVIFRAFLQLPTSVLAPGLCQFLKTAKPDPNTRRLSKPIQHLNSSKVAYREFLSGRAARRFLAAAWPALAALKRAVTPAKQSLSTLSCISK